MSSENGGPAFPIPGKSYSYPEGRFEDDPHCGMTLRDYFAAKVIQGLMAASVKSSPDGFAEAAYKVADAMLAARNEPR